MIFHPDRKRTGGWWCHKLNETMIEAGKEEKRLAELNGDHHQDVPASGVSKVEHGRASTAADQVFFFSNYNIAFDN